MSKGFIAAVIAWFVKSLFFWLSGYDPYKEIDSFFKYVVDFGSFILVYIPIEYFVKRKCIKRNQNRTDDEGIMKKERLSLFLIVALAAALPAAYIPVIGKTQMLGDVLKPVQTFMDGMVKHDFALMSSAWHPNGKLFVMETMQPLEFLRNIPPVVKIEVDKTDVLSVDGMIAVVKVEWKMLMPKTIGCHRSYMNLIQIEGAWKIISETDYGDEKER